MFIKGNCLTTSIVLSFSHCTSLRKKCPYSELFWSAFSPHSDWMLCISQYSVRMRENAGKMRTGITTNTDTFYAVHIMKFQQGSRNSVRSLPRVRNFFFRLRQEFLEFTHLFIPLSIAYGSLYLVRVLIRKLSFTIETEKSDEICHRAWLPPKPTYCTGTYKRREVLWNVLYFQTPIRSTKSC